jgi:hypothetical protein
LYRIINVVYWDIFRHLSSNKYIKKTAASITKRIRRKFNLENKKTNASIKFDISLGISTVKNKKMILLTVIILPIKICIKIKTINIEYKNVYNPQYNSKQQALQIKSFLQLGNSACF